jgi:RNA polymerase sigma-70 factor, ECF subfamily
VSSFSAARLPVLPLSERKSRAETAHEAGNAELSKVSDETLIAQLTTGDQESLGVLFERHARVTRGVALRILRDPAEAEDLVQDLFLFINRKCAIFDSSKSSATSWIIQMAYHRAIERRRYLTTRHFYSRADTEDVRSQVVGVPTTESDYSPEAVLGRNGLEKLFRELTDDQRETLRLYFFEGFTIAEIATKRGQPHGNVRHHYYRGLSKLRERMFGTTVRETEPHEK